ncbi:hypothetical protein D0962_34450 [Leptolyngbyaceae cyanobacterium CCMR0082]|uniref:Uncharacterized protein n=1 Tax=Adonisia turfae CCMR0082 TaxID=2304604 RepID=A0A6M0SIK6_9CYAN|nr:hypothetical protein [Adonisia turfae]NEZ67801.1 hypothetical protein [Adonisia turfae CCMR0082]
MSNLILTVIPELNAEIRRTEDGRCSVYDLIRAIGQRDPYNTWKRLTEGYSEVLTICQDWKFKGARQRKTPVVDLQGWFQILPLLPGAMGKRYREEAAKLVTRYIQGDVTLADEIRDRGPDHGTEATPEESALALPPPKEVAELTRYILGPVKLGKTEEQGRSLKAGAEISAIQALYPSLAPALKPAQELLASTNTIDKEDGVWLTPTTLGKRLGISAIKVNRSLRDMGLQTKVDKPAKGEPGWLPTEQGKEYSSMTAATGGNGDTTTYQHLKWSERVLDLFTVNVEATAA